MSSGKFKTPASEKQFSNYFLWPNPLDIIIIIQI